MLPGWCPAKVGAPPVRERTKTVQVFHISYGNERNSLGVSVNFESLIMFSTAAYHLVQTFKTRCLPNSISHSFIRCFVPSGSHRVEPLGGSGCGSSFALQDLNQ